MSLSSYFPTLSDLQTQVHDTQSSLANQVEKVGVLADMTAERDSIKRDASLLRQLVEESSTAQDGEREEEQEGSRRMRSRS